MNGDANDLSGFLSNTITQSVCDVVSGGEKLVQLHNGDEAAETVSDTTMELNYLNISLKQDISSEPVVRVASPNKGTSQLGMVSIVYRSFYVA